MFVRGLSVDGILYMGAHATARHTHFTVDHRKNLMDSKVGKSTI